MGQISEQTRAGLARRRRMLITGIRIGIGGFWGCCAWFTTQPDSIALLHQASSLKSSTVWHDLWRMLAVSQPALFIWLVAILEGLIALCLVVGRGGKIAAAGSALSSFFLWSIHLPGITTNDNITGLFNDTGIMIVILLISLGVLFAQLADQKLFQSYYRFDVRPTHQPKPAVVAGHHRSIAGQTTRPARKLAGTGSSDYSTRIPIQEIEATTTRPHSHRRREVALKP